MKDHLITFATSKLALQKGFNLPPELLISNSNVYSNHFDIPTQSLLQKWLRENHKIYINIITSFSNNQIIYTNEIYDALFCSLKTSNHFNSYEKALEESLYEALLLLK